LLDVIRNEVHFAMELVLRCCEYLAYED
jgi:hypothetical protein